MAMSLPAFLAVALGGGALSFMGAKFKREAEMEAEDQQTARKMMQESIIKQMMSGNDPPDTAGQFAYGKSWEKAVKPYVALTAEAIRQGKEANFARFMQFAGGEDARGAGPGGPIVPLTGSQAQALPPHMVAPQAQPHRVQVGPQPVLQPPRQWDPMGETQAPVYAPGKIEGSLEPPQAAPPTVVPPPGAGLRGRRPPRGGASITMKSDGDLSVTKTQATDEALKDYDRAQFIAQLVKLVPNTSLHPRLIREAEFDVPAGYLDEVGQAAFDMQMLAQLQKFRNERGRMPNTTEQPMLLFEAAQAAGYVPKHLASQMFQTPADADNAFLAAFQGTWEKFQPIFERGGITFQEYTDLIAQTVGRPPSREHLAAAYEYARNATRARLANDPRFRTNVGALEAELNRLVPQGVTEPSLQRQDRPLPQTPAQQFQGAVGGQPVPLERNLPLPGAAPAVRPVPVPGPGAAAPAPGGVTPVEQHRLGVEQINREARAKVAAEPVPRTDAARLHDPYSFQNVQPANKGDMDTGLQTRKYIQVDPEKAAGLLQLERYFQRYFPALEVLMPYMTSGGRTAALRWLTEGIEIKLPHPLPRFGFEIPAGAFGQPLITSVMKGLGVPEAEAINVLQAVAELTFLKNEAPVIAYQITGQRMAAELAKSEIKSFPAMEGSREAQEARTIAFWRLTEARRQAVGGAPLGPTVTSDDLMAGVEQFAKSTKQSADTILKLYESGHKATQNSVQARAYANSITRAHGKR